MKNNICVKIVVGESRVIVGSGVGGVVKGIGNVNGEGMEVW